jgi:hypothetical protein
VLFVVFKEEKMITESFIINPPENSQQKIWRYTDLSKFVDLLNSSSLYFCRSDLLGDEHEGALSKIDHTNFWGIFNDLDKEEVERARTKFPDALRRDFAINCWHTNDFESAAMWKLYLKSNEGIAIQSTYNRLFDSLNKSVLHFAIGRVSYIDYDSQSIGSDINGQNRFFYKRRSFEHEHELRAIISSLTNSFVDNTFETDPNFGKGFVNGGIRVNIDLSELIQTIYLAPNSPKWQFAMIEDLCLKYGYNFKIQMSSMNDNALF